MQFDGFMAWLHIPVWSVGGLLAGLLIGYILPGRHRRPWRRAGSAKWPAIGQQSSQDRESLTKGELACLGDGMCPDCGHKTLVGGPQAGVAINVACRTCGAEYNLMGPLGGHRNSDRGSPDLERLRSAFGIMLSETSHV